MIDFRNESTVSTPPGDVVKIVILERREQVIEALESYHLLSIGDQDASLKLDIIHARIMALWYQLQAMAKRRLKAAKGTDEDPSYDMVKEAITTSKLLDHLVEAFEWMNIFVDDMGLTQIDSRARYDRSNIEDANLKKGM